MIFPENSTRIFVQHLIRVIEKIDGIAERQVSSFLQVDPRSENPNITYSLANIHNTVDTMISTLSQKKRMVRREPSYNYIAPTDVSELSSLVKALRIPIQGLGLSRAMEENMRKAEARVYEDMETMQDDYDEYGRDLHLAQRPRSFYGGTSEDELTSEEEKDESSDVDLVDTVAPQVPPTSHDSSNSTSTSTSASTSSERTSCTRRRKTKWDDSLKVMTYWRQDYDEVLNIVKPVYLELSDACSVALNESIKRLRRLQGLDPRYEDKPFFYKYYYRWKVGAEREKKEALEFEYARLNDHSFPLLAAMEKFYKQRLVGLERLYAKSGVPRRILFLLLTFQFNLHAYAQCVYTLSSMIYELDQIRLEKKVWWPHLTIRKWFSQKHKSDDPFDLDNPAAVADHDIPLDLQKTLSRRATIQRDERRKKMDLENGDGKEIYKIDTPNRGHAHSPKEHHDRHPYNRSESAKPRVNPWLQNTLDPMVYYDPDVNYPETARERFFYKIYVFLMKYLYTDDISFSIRAASVVACLSLPGFLESSVGWYNEVRGQWAVVVAFIWMGPSVGSNFFG